MGELEIACYRVDSVEPGPATSWDRGGLRVDLAAIADEAAGEAAIESVTAGIVRPGEPVRIAGVLDAVVPDVREEGVGRTFPGLLGAPVRAGHGRVRRLTGANVLSVCDLPGAGFDEAAELPLSLVDMDGPAARTSLFGSTLNLVLEFAPAAGASAADLDRAIRRATLRAAARLAETTRGSEPDEIERVSRQAEAPDPELPAVAALLQVASEGPLLDTFLYGQPLPGLVPTLLDPAEVLDGALVNGAYDWSSVRNPTACYQASALIRELVRADGDTLRLAGVIAAPSYLDTAFEKERAAMLTARLAALLGADGVVCTTFSSGNSQTDTMLTIAACEALGIRTVALLAETGGGLTDHVDSADCLVSVGNEDELVDAWSPERVLGRAAASAGRAVPTAAYLGATCQLGDGLLTAVAA